ncbi:TetR/AcrR family transcriptional regulator C-terminal domain-containing protein [Fodinicola feengrottensis]|uniref:TetR/AcrR family transcriptional regulator n=1 Tax=Fodinicola feengrottensis TaxID=435914 RepID=A0ABN2GP97_9ACTN|nr:TetR/AcrR family transcriptional regulator [Fodinicola feengrottensis]
MAIEHGGSGDPRRSLELMWGIAPRPTRGPKQRLTIAQITAAAVAVADAEGLSALAMRRVAEQLGVSVMSLYTYVPGKGELIDLMVDGVLAELSTDFGENAGWRDRLGAIARDLWVLYRRHPWLLQVNATSRPPLGPHTIAVYEHQLWAVEGIGLSDVQMDSVILLISGYVQGAARGAVDSAQAEQSTGLTDLQWWEAHEPVLDKVMDPTRYPLAVRVGSAAGDAHQAAFNPDYNFTFGLERVLDGIAALIHKA